MDIPKQRKTPCGLKFSEKKCYASCVNYEKCKPKGGEQVGKSS